MATTQQIGTEGEHKACLYLESSGYKIAETNWRFRRYEIDIIAWLEDLLVIVEVKTRGASDCHKPEAAVSMAQWDNIAIATGAYMTSISYDWEVRFDIVAVTIHRNGESTLKHFKDVYFPDR